MDWTSWILDTTAYTQRQFHMIRLTVVPGSCLVPLTCQRYRRYLTTFPRWLTADTLYRRRFAAALPGQLLLSQVYQHSLQFWTSSPFTGSSTATQQQFTVPHIPLRDYRGSLQFACRLCQDIQATYSGLRCAG